MSQRESLPGLERTMILLENIAPRNSGMAFNEIKDLFPEAPASTVSRLLKALLDDELIKKKDEERNYHIGPRARSLGRILCGNIDRAEQLRQIVCDLAEETGHSAAYFELRNNENTLIVKHEIPEAFHYMPEGNSNINFTRHGCAKVLLAYQDDKTFTSLCSKHNIEIQNRYRDDIAEIQRSGVNINHNDDRDYYSRIAAPVFARDQFSGAIGITVLGQYSTEEYESLAEQVKKAAKKATSKLSIF